MAILRASGEKWRLTSKIMREMDEYCETAYDMDSLLDARTCPLCELYGHITECPDCPIAIKEGHQCDRDGGPYPGNCPTHEDAKAFSDYLHNLADELQESIL